MWGEQVGSVPLGRKKAKFNTEEHLRTVSTVNVVTLREQGPRWFPRPRARRGVRPRLPQGLRRSPATGVRVFQFLRGSREKSGETGPTSSSRQGKEGRCILLCLVGHGVDRILQRLDWTSRMNLF